MIDCCVNRIDREETRDRIAFYSLQLKQYAVLLTVKFFLLDALLNQLGDPACIYGTAELCEQRMFPRIK